MENLISKGSNSNLVRNCHIHHIHGGIKNFSKALWKIEKEINTKDNVGVALSHFSPDGEEGYPGNLESTTQYTLNNNNELHIDYFAKSDKTTVVNFTNHSYFNLAGAGNGDILNHKLMLNTNFFLPIYAGGLPTSKIHKVRNTPMDFTKFRSLASAIDPSYEQIRLAGGGYDHTFVINAPWDADKKLTLVGQAYEPNSGRTLEVKTNNFGVQLYSSNFSDNFFIQGKVEKI